MAVGGANAGASVLTVDPRGNGFRGEAVTADPPNSDGTNGEAAATVADADDAGNAPKPASLRANAVEVLKKDGNGEKTTPEVELEELPNNGEVDEDAEVTFPAAGDEENEPMLSLRANVEGKFGNKDEALVAADPPKPPNNCGFDDEAELTLLNAPMPLSLRANVAELPKEEGNREAPVSKTELPNNDAATKGEEGPGNKNEGDVSLKIPAPPPADVDAAADGLSGKQ